MVSVRRRLMPKKETDPKEKAFEWRIRFRYALIFLLLLAEEIYIGVFVQDRFVRPYVGDFLVVVLLYFLVRIFCIRKPVYLSVWILLFAIIVEITQVFPLVDLLGIKSHFLRVIMGTSFAWADVLAYLLGSVINFLWDVRIKRIRRS